MVRFRASRSGRDSRPDDLGRTSGDGELLSWCREVVRQVGGLEAAAQACTDDELKARTALYKSRLAQGEPAAALLPEAYATVREAARRAIGQRHHDVQVMGGAALHRGMIVEMRTGEGKTLTATMPAYLAALSGQPVHVMTANDYLATRDANWMRPVYESLGMSVGLLEPSPSPDRATRRAQYVADITYGPWSEFCNDFLRDNLAWDLDEMVQRGTGSAIVDEADLIMIDNMPVASFITGPADHKENRHETVARAVAALSQGSDFTADLTTGTAVLTDAGMAKVEDWFGASNLYDETTSGLGHLVENAVRARALYERDRDYLVAGDQILAIDKTSGRPHQSRYGEGIHEALEAKEGLPVQPATQTLATVMVCDYVRKYDVLSGMTGTAVSDAPIYRSIYALDVIAIPTNRPVIRIDCPDMLYRTRQAKLAALAADARRRAAAGQPVLIGAMSAADAEAVSSLLSDAGVAHELLAARNFEREAQVLAEAARPGAVTIVVKMAGRGVDILLGGSSRADYEAVADEGGLCVLGTERNSDRRTELHLRGRAGRQGDPGESLFYLSAEDEVIGIMMRQTPKSLLADGAPFGYLSRVLDKRQISNATAQAAWYKNNVAFDDVLAEQQRVFYAERQTILRQPDMRAQVTAILDEVLVGEVTSALRAGDSPEVLVMRLGRLYKVATAPAYIAIALQRARQDSLPEVLSAVRRDAREAYENREAQLGPEVMRELERRVLLSVSDRAWRQHLADVGDLRAAIVIRAAGGMPSLPEYRREAAGLYAQMNQQIRQEVIKTLFFMEIRMSRDSE